MTEEKTCYNCGNKNCHIFYSTVKQDVAEHHETYEYRGFDCVNHDKWEEMKVEEIRTDSMETLKNALERIKKLEKENAELRTKTTAFENANRAMVKELDDMTSVGVSVLENVVRSKEQLTEAKEIIGEFVEWANWQGSKCPSFKSIQNKAEQFLKTEVLAVWNPKRTQNDPDKLTDDVMNDWKEMED